MGQRLHLSIEQDFFSAVCPDRVCIFSRERRQRKRIIHPAPPSIKGPAPSRLAEARLQGRHRHAALHHAAAVAQEPWVGLSLVAPFVAAPKRLRHPLERHSIPLQNFVPSLSGHIIVLEEEIEENERRPFPCSPPREARRARSSRQRWCARPKGKPPPRAQAPAAPAENASSSLISTFPTFVQSLSW